MADTASVTQLPTAQHASIGKALFSAKSAVQHLENVSRGTSGDPLARAYAQDILRRIATEVERLSDLEKALCARGGA